MWKRYVFVSLCTLLFATSLSAQIVINEINYNPLEAGIDTTEFIEFYNAGPTDVNIGGYLTSAVNLTFPAGTTIAGGDYFVICVDSASFRNFYGFDADMQWTSGNLNNNGETVWLFDPSFNTIDGVGYDDISPWPTGAGSPDGFGPSVELINPTYENTAGANWLASTGSGAIGGTPGSQNSVFDPNEAPVISSVSQSPTIPTSSNAVAISAIITDDTSIDTARVFYNTGSGFTFTTMSNTSGDTYSAEIPPQPDGTIVQYYVYAADGTGFNDISPDTSNSTYYTYQVNNSGDVAQLVINEIFYDEIESAEWVEIYNGTGEDVDLSQWLLCDSFSSFRIPDGTIIENNGFIVITNSISSFQYDHPSVGNVVGDYFFDFNSESDIVVLKDVNAQLSDSLFYENGSNNWPAMPQFVGLFAIELLDVTFNNELGINWRLGPDTLGTPGFGIVDLDPPAIKSVTATSATNIDVMFDENVNLATAQDVSNYVISNSIGNPTAATRDGSNAGIVHLTVPALTTSIVYTITIGDVEDILGNPMSTEQASFTWQPQASPGDVIITEIMQNPAAVSDGFGEWLELYNTTDQAIDLSGWILRDNDFDSHTITSSLNAPLIIQPGGFLVLGTDSMVGQNGFVPMDYDYDNFFLSNGSDEVILVDGSVSIDEVLYDNGLTFPDPIGASMILLDFQTDNSVGSNWSTSVIREENYVVGTTGDNGSPGTLGNDQGLPVLLSSFATGSGDGVVIISWTTESEVNSSTFEIWRSTDKEGEYTLQKELEAEGGANTETHYDYGDYQVINGTEYWYKLIDIDITGIRTVHGIRRAKPQLLEPVGTDETLPTKFALYNAYPNPFNPTTRLRFDVPNLGDESALDVNISIYNSIGQHIKTLYRGRLDPQVYELEWNGRTDGNVSVAGGVYFAVFRSRYYFKTIRMTLIK